MVLGGRGAEMVEKHAVLEFGHRTRKFKDTFVFTVGRWMVPT